MIFRLSRMPPSIPMHSPINLLIAQALMGSHPQHQACPVQASSARWLSDPKPCPASLLQNCLARQGGHLAFSGSLASEPFPFLWRNQSLPLLIETEDAQTLQGSLSVKEMCQRQSSSDAHTARGSGSQRPAGAVTRQSPRRGGRRLCKWLHSASQPRDGSKPSMAGSCTGRWFSGPCGDGVFT